MAIRSCAFAAGATATTQAAAASAARALRAGSEPGEEWAKENRVNWRLRSHLGVDENKWSENIRNRRGSRKGSKNYCFPPSPFERHGRGPAQVRIRGRGRISGASAAVQLTGNVGLLSAVNDRFSSATGMDHPVFTLVRLQRSVGSQSRLGMAYLDQADGSTSNRVAELGAGCSAGSTTSTSNSPAAAPTTAQIR